MENREREQFTTTTTTITTEYLSEGRGSDENQMTRQADQGVPFPIRELTQTLPVCLSVRLPLPEDKRRERRQKRQEGDGDVEAGRELTSALTSSTSLACDHTVLLSHSH